MSVCQKRQNCSIYLSPFENLKFKTVIFDNCDTTKMTFRNSLTPVKMEYLFRKIAIGSPMAPIVITRASL